MALVNVAGTNTYGVIESFNLDKVSKVVGFTFRVYTNSSKSNLMFSRDFSLSCLSNHRKVTSMSKKEPDGLEVDGDYFFVPIDATGDWQLYAGKFLQYMQINEILEKHPLEADEGIHFEDTSSGKVYKVKADKTTTQEICGNSTCWSEFFDFSVSTAPNTNIVQQCYEYIKDTNIFPDTIDA